MGLTQAAAAERMGVTSRTVSRYEGRLRATRDATVSLEAQASTGDGPQTGPRRGCGTYLAFRLHQLLGEEPCAECQMRVPSRIVQRYEAELRDRDTERLAA
jgi:hypothetical protein